MKDHLMVKKIRRGYMVVNTRTGNHAHFKSSYGCYCIKLFIREGVIPDNPYLKESYRRLTMKKPEHKMQYINIPVKGYIVNY